MTSKEIWEKYGGRKIKYDGAIGTLASINKESFDFIMFYFDNGQMLTSIKYNLTEPTTRKRACRILNKAKGMIDYD